MSKRKKKAAARQAAAQAAAQTAASAAAGESAPEEPVESAAEEEFSTLDEHGEDRRPVTDREYMKKRDKNYVDFSALAQAEDELHRLKEEHGIQEKHGIFYRIMERYYDWKENRTLHLVNKKVYLFLNIFGGWCGLHRFYERRWLLGLFYLLLSWSLFPAILCATDLFVILPKKPDENGRVWM